MIWFLKQIVYFLGVVLFVLLSVAFFVLLERQILGHVTRRQGPTTIGLFGSLQTIADALKLLAKESIFPKSSNSIIFIFAPIFTCGLALANWLVIPFGNGWALADFNLGLLYLLALSSLSVHSIIMAGWSSNSKYAFLGALRSAAQMISYEIALGLILIAVIFLAQSLNLNDIVMAQFDIWFCIPLLPFFLMFLICILAETNRHPFDLPEAEAELVSGYNVEYSAVGFVLFFLAEYSNIIMMSAFTAILFLGGWNFPYYIFFENMENLFLQYLLESFIIPSFVFTFKTLSIMIFFVIVRTALPRYRYDQLMRLGWKIFLPIALSLIIIYISFFIFFF
jgi:NADH-quinone oxidoreductase subunit H